MRNISSYPGGVPLSIKYPNMPVYSFLENTARKFPHRNAVNYLGKDITYSKLWNESKKLANGLKELGLRKGGRIALMLPNIPQFLISYYGILSAGGIVVPINPLLPNEEVERELTLTECKAVITLDIFQNKLEENNQNKTIVTDVLAYAPLRLRIIGQLRKRYTSNLTHIKFSELLKTGSIIEPVTLNSKEDLAVIIFTSGSTGPPKGVMLTHYNLVVNALQSYYWLRGWGYSPRPQPLGWPVVLCAVPFFHSYGMVIMNEAIQFGCNLVLIPIPTSKAILRSIEKYKVTHFPSIPRYINEILNSKELEKFDLSSLSHFSSGGSSISSRVIKRFETVSGAGFYQGYGLTEAGPSTHATPVGEKTNYESVGLPLPDTDVKIVDLEKGEITIPDERTGEIAVRGPQIMRGYWKDPVATSNTLKGEWLFTGDIGYVDSDGYLYVLGRKKDRISSEGHTIHPGKIEEIIRSNSLVEAAAVIGLPDPLRCSTEIIGLVVLKKGGENDKEKLMKYCAERLEPYQVPSKIEFFDDLPMTPLGEVDRLEISKRIAPMLVRARCPQKE